MPDLVVRRIRGANAATFARASSRLEPEGGDAELLVGSPIDDALVAGAFERRERGRLVRGSGGATVSVGPGTVWVILRLARPDALVACDAPRLMNRYVRPLLKALGRTGARAAYFDRDWFAVAHRPAGMVAFAHDASSGVCTFEAFVAVTTPFARGMRESYRGREPATIETLTGRGEPLRVVDALVDAYADGSTVRELPFSGEAAEPVAHDDPPWLATVSEAIGIVGATGASVGGELMASRDAMARVAREMRDARDVGALVDDVFTSGAAVVYGVRSLRSIAEVIETARSRQ